VGMAASEPMPPLAAGLVVRSDVAGAPGATTAAQAVPPTVPADSEFEMVPPECPTCGRAMLEKTDHTDGSTFFLCLFFPECLGKAPASAARRKPVGISAKVAEMLEKNAKVLAEIGKPPICNSESTVMTPHSCTSVCTLL